jgi:hypothetical protein
MRIIVLIITFSFILSCSRKSKLPEGVLPQKTMINVMWDLLRADQYISTFLIPDPGRSKKDSSVKLYEEIFSIYKISPEQFRKSLNYYRSDPILLQPIIEGMSTKQQEELKSNLRPSDRRTIDSLDPRQDSSRKFQRLKK